jgi:hypothetical protein
MSLAFSDKEKTKAFCQKMVLIKRKGVKIQRLRNAYFKADSEQNIRKV